jgi:hypothetical protein
MQAEIYGRFEHLADTDAGALAVEEYLSSIERGESAIEADTVASNVLQRAGFGVNAAGGVSVRVASIDHNEQPGARVSLVIDHDERGYFVATSDGEDTGPRFASADEAFASIGTRWGAGWGLRLAGE